MKTLIYYVRIYMRLAAQDIKSRMVYKVDFFFGFLGEFVINVLSFLSIVVIFQTIPQLAGWDYYELLFLYGFFHLVRMPTDIFFDKLWFLQNAVRTGDFIICYLRPLNTLFYFISGEIRLKNITALVLSVFLLIYTGNKLHISWTFLKGLCFFLMFTGSALTLLGIRIIVASTAFWVINNVFLMNFHLKLYDFSRYPISIFSKPFRFFFTYVLPFAFIAYVPVNALLKTGDVTLSWLITPLVGCGVFALACLVWTLGVRQYTGTGT
ncbi:MAG: ABC-2 family transporter protein [Spirochaetales bacterium]|nr:ABC-2 family transporter protein [Spirochaetales bacterium]